MYMIIHAAVRAHNVGRSGCQVRRLGRFGNENESRKKKEKDERLETYKRITYTSLNKFVDISRCWGINVGNFAET